MTYVDSFHIHTLQLRFCCSDHYFISLLLLYSNPTAAARLVSLMAWFLPPHSSFWLIVLSFSFPLCTLVLWSSLTVFQSCSRGASITITLWNSSLHKISSVPPPLFFLVASFFFALYILAPFSFPSKGISWLTHYNPHFSGF